MTTRRTTLQLIAGAGVGALFTPAPWKLIRDTALWSQDWPGIPHPLRGEIKGKTATCALCPAACPIKARCIGEQPISLAGVNGGLCAVAVTAHQLPYWPDRVRKGPIEEARAAVAKIAPDAPVAVLDLRPGRPASAAYRKAMSDRHNGIYLTPRQPQTAVNLAAAKTVISLGAPVLDGFVAPAAAWAARDKFRLIQVEPELSRTAALADQWLPQADPAALARESEGPVLVVDCEMSAAVVALSAKETVAALPPSGGADLTSVADASIRLLYIDESHPGSYIPWPEIQPKLAKDSVVIAFAWSPEGYARHATFVLPAPVFPEATDLMKAPEWTVDPAEFVTGAKAAGEPAPAPPEGFLRVNPLNGWIGPISTKLTQESELLLAPRQVAVNPSSGIAERSRAYLQTALGKVEVRVVHDASLAPGHIRYLPTPDILDLGDGAKVVGA